MKLGTLTCFLFCPNERLLFRRLNGTIKGEHPTRAFRKGERQRAPSTAETEWNMVFAAITGLNNTINGQKQRITNPILFSWAFPLFWDKIEHQFESFGSKEPKELVEETWILFLTFLSFLSFNYRRAVSYIRLFVYCVDVSGVIISMQSLANKVGPFSPKLANKHRSNGKQTRKSHFRKWVQFLVGFVYFKSKICSRNTFFSKTCIHKREKWQIERE